MKLLPQWDKIVSFEVPMWTPYGLDYRPVSFIGGADRFLKDIAFFSMELESEFIYLKGIRFGEVGVVTYDKTIDPGRDMVFPPLGFIMIFSYSRAMEKLISSFLKDDEDMEAGICFCDLLDRQMRLGGYKAIAIMSNNPFFDDGEFLENFVRELSKGVENKTPSSMTFFAEKFGYRRFFIPYETDNITDLAISGIFNNFEIAETESMLGSVDHRQFR
ncbi:MAG: hypothetical protein H5T90_01850 [Acetomicrobium sp.]|nr:hypothetical protein [Acetomicrobium sp.]